MQTDQSLEKYKDKSKTLPSVHYILNKLIESHYQDLNHINKISDIDNTINTPSALTNLTEHPNETIPAKDWKKSGFPADDSEHVYIHSERIRSVVHEVNTPLGIIKNYINILGIKLSDKNIVQDEIRIIKEEIDRISHLLRKLHTVSSDKAEKTEANNINEQLADIVKIMKEFLLETSNVAIKLDLEKSLPSIFTKKDNMKQVFINLIKNSIDAMPNGGSLKIQTRYIQKPYTEKAIHYLHQSKGDIQIIISDEGTGIPPEIESKIFQPFVTTKLSGHSGLGLSIVREIVESLHGTITCKNNQKIGTTFTIKIPVYNKDSA